MTTTTKLTLALLTIATTTFAQEWKKTNDKTGLYAQDKNGGVKINVGIGTLHPNFRLEVFGRTVLY